MNKVIVSIGSNIEPSENIALAKRILKDKFILLKESKTLPTKPEGFIEQDDFLNCAVLIESNLSEAQLKDSLLKIENQLGRVRTENKDGPRTIDLDITVFNGSVVDKDYQKYEFVRELADALSATEKGQELGACSSEREADLGKR